MLAKDLDSKWNLRDDPEAETNTEHDAGAERAVKPVDEVDTKGEGKSTVPDRETRSARKPQRQRKTKSKHCLTTSPWLQHRRKIDVRVCKIREEHMTAYLAKSFPYSLTQLADDRLGALSTSDGSERWKLWPPR